MSQLRQQQERLEEVNIQVKVVTFDDQAMATAYVEATKLEWPLLIDADRKLYSAYTMQRGNLWSVAKPLAILGYLGLFLRGQKLNKPGSDLLQMGGDVLIDPAGVVRLHVASQDPHDRPSPKTILKVVEAASSNDNPSA